LLSGALNLFLVEQKAVVPTACEGLDECCARTSSVVLPLHPWTSTCTCTGAWTTLKLLGPGFDGALFRHNG
jgi:hypothetical protein